MKLHCIFAKLPGEDAPELIDAWDEFTIEANEDGWFAALNKAMRDPQYASVREVVIVVPTKAVMDAFKTPVIDGAVDGAERTRP